MGLWCAKRELRNPVLVTEKEKESTLDMAVNMTYRREESFFWSLGVRI